MFGELKRIAGMRVLVTIGLSQVLTACIGTGGETPTGSADANTSAFKVAMLLPNSLDDQGWRQAGYEGLLLVEKELGAEVAYTARVR